jgi:hypothetical protein
MNPTAEPVSPAPLCVRSAASSRDEQLTAAERPCQSKGCSTGRKGIGSRRAGGSGRVASLRHPWGEGCQFGLLGVLGRFV